MRSDDELRDLFACSALSAMQNAYDAKDTAKRAYQMADAMMSARRKPKTEIEIGSRWREYSGKVLKVIGMEIGQQLPYQWVHEADGMAGYCLGSYLLDECVQITDSENGT